MEIKNFYNDVKMKKYHNPNYGKKHFIELPFRMLIVGSSGSGKTNSLCNLLHRFDNTFGRIIICVKSKDEPLYERLAKTTPEIEFYERKVPSVEEIEAQMKKDKDSKKYSNLIIWDDMVGDKEFEKPIAEWYKRGRKVAGGFSCCFLSQSFFRTPKFAREQLSHLVIVQAGARDFNRIVKEYPSLIDPKELYQAFGVVKRRNPMNFLMVYCMNGNLAENFDKPIDIRE